jgi:hypothetical protein
MFRLAAKGSRICACEQVLAIYVKILFFFVKGLPEFNHMSSILSALGSFTRRFMRKQTHAHHPHLFEFVFRINLRQPAINRPIDI